MAGPLVSIIIPCYNAEKYVGEAIESALDQTYLEKEVIVIDDGSTDGSVEVLKSFGKHIQWEKTSNRGACAARNRGLALARGKIIQFLDSDDLLMPEKLQIQVPLLLEQKVDCVSCKGIARSYEGGRVVTRYYPRQSDPFRQCCLDILTICGPIHTKQSLDDIGGFRDELPCCQERDLHLRLAMNGVSFIHVNEELFICRKRFGSVSDNHVRVIDQYQNIYLKAYNEMKEYWTLTDDKAKVLAEVMVEGARVYLKYGELEKANNYFMIAEGMHLSKGYGVYSRMAIMLVKLLGPVYTDFILRLKKRIIS